MGSSPSSLSGTQRLRQSQPQQPETTAIHLRKPSGHGHQRNTTGWSTAAADPANARLLAILGTHRRRFGAVAFAIATIRHICWTVLYTVGRRLAFAEFAFAIATDGRRAAAVQSAAGGGFSRITHPVAADWARRLAISRTILLILALVDIALAVATHACPWRRAVAGAVGAVFLVVRVAHSVATSAAAAASRSAIDRTT